MVASNQDSDVLDPYMKADSLLSAFKFILIFYCQRITFTWLLFPFSIAKICITLKKTDHNQPNQRYAFIISYNCIRLPHNYTTESHNNQDFRIKFTQSTNFIYQKNITIMAKTIRKTHSIYRKNWRFYAVDVNDNRDNEAKKEPPDNAGRLIIFSLKFETRQIKPCP